ncbi:MAG: prephenate dehydratase domain-containing protein [Gemmatimonadota bacterium]
MKVLYQGIAGAYSHLAVLAHQPGARAEGVRDFAAIVQGVASGSADRGLVPISNTIVGAVPGAAEAIESSPEVEILATFDQRITHCLAALPAADLASIRWVESHPVALAQCARWLSGRRLAPHAVEDTAGAARAIAADRDWTRAAICNAEAAERYGLVVLARDIADCPDNYTTFALVGRRVAAAVRAA